MRRFKTEERLSDSKLYFGPICSSLGDVCRSIRITHVWGFAELPSGFRRDSVKRLTMPGFCLRNRRHENRENVRERLKTNRKQLREPK